MLCTDQEEAPVAAGGLWVAGAGAAAAPVLVLLLLASGCANRAPEPALSSAPGVPAPISSSPAALPPVARAPAAPPAPVLPEEAPAPFAGTGAVINLGPKVALPPAQPARTWDEFKRQAARRMVAASPKAIYMSKPPPMLFGIPILEVELNGDGSVRGISVTRPPANIDARNTIDYAMEAVRRGAPYGDMSRLAKPWKWTEVFLFNDQRKFKPRTLD